MEIEWMTRLRDLIEEDPRSYLQLAEDAGLGRNFVQQMLKNNKEPGAYKLFRLLDALGGGNAALYILTGKRVSQEDFQFLELISQLPDEVKNSAADMFRKLIKHSKADHPSGLEL